jgi:hypothetical protein
MGKPAASRKPGRPTKEQAEVIEGLKEKWLEAYRQDGWTAACHLVGVSFSTPSWWKHHDVHFREAFEEAQPAVADRMERLAEECIQGTREMDRAAMTLLIFRLKALRPHLYRDRVSLEHTGAGGGAIKVEQQGDAVVAPALAGGARPVVEDMALMAAAAPAAGCGDFLGSRAWWMLGSTPPLGMVASPSSLFSSSSLRMASWMWRGMMRVFLLSRDALPASSSSSAVRYSSTAARYTGAPAPTRDAYLPCFR